MHTSGNCTSPTAVDLITPMIAASAHRTGVAIGTNDFCKDRGCLGIFLNNDDLYSVLKMDLDGSCVQYNGVSMAPNFSPVPI